jgi:hypothetical protein
MRGGHSDLLLEPHRTSFYLFLCLVDKTLVWWGQLVRSRAAGLGEIAALITEALQADVQ